MHTDQNKECERGSARAARQRRAGGAVAESRLVIRDERIPQGDNPGGGESLKGEAYKDHEAEIYRIERRGREPRIISYPVPLESANPALAHVDWCAFTVKPPDSKGNTWVMDELREHFGFTQFTPRKTGLYGYKSSALIEEGGLIAWGGKNQRGTVYVSLNGQGCFRIRDWRKLHDWCRTYRATLTRVDPAHDDHLGEVISIEKAHQWWIEGGFNSGGRKPHAEPDGDWWGLEKGRTVYIGERLNGKLLRVYEKGKQQGDPKSPWVRVELELHNKDRVIPWDVLLRPGAYLAGAYPCLRFLSAEQCRIKTTRKAASISYGRAVEVARQQVGRLVGLMVKVKGGDYAEVVQALKREGMPRRLEPYSYHIRTDAEFANWLESGEGDDVAPVAS